MGWTPTTSRLVPTSSTSRPGSGLCRLRAFRPDDLTARRRCQLQLAARTRYLVLQGAVCVSAGILSATPYSTASMRPCADCDTRSTSWLTSDSGVLVWCRKSTLLPCRCGSPTATSKLTITVWLRTADAFGSSGATFQYVKGGALRERWHPLGHTVLYGEYEKFDDANSDYLVNAGISVARRSGVWAWCRKSTRLPCRCGCPTATSKLTSAVSVAPTLPDSLQSAWTSAALPRTSST